MPTEYYPSPRDTIKSTQFRSDLAAKRSMQWVDKIDAGLLGGVLRRGLDYVDGAEELERTSWGTVLPEVAKKLWLEHQLPEKKFIQDLPICRFIGGITGRTGTGWLLRNLGWHMPDNYAAISEVGLINFAQFRAAPYEYFYHAGNSPEGSRRYLEYYKKFLLRHAYNSEAVMANGARGLRDLVPPRAIRAGIAELSRRLEVASGIESCYQIFGDFYCWLFNFHAIVSVGSPFWISKEPAYGRFASDLLRLVPSAKLVILARDGRDVALSMLKRGWHPNVRTAIDRWRDSTTLALLSLQDIPDTTYKIVRYEDLVTNYEASILAIIDFLALPVPAKLLTDGKIGPIAGSIGQWKTTLEKDDLAYYEHTCAELASRLGYS